MDECKALVQQLHGANSLPTRTRAAKQLLHLLEADRIRPIDAVLADVVPPLLQAAQMPERSASSLAPDPSKTPASVIEFADAALLVLDCLCAAGTETLKEAGWHVDDDGTGRGRSVFLNPSTGESQENPPDLSATFDLVPEDQWALQLLFELPTITSPYANPLNGSLCWPARVRFHEPETNQWTPHAGLVAPAHKLALTVVDVAQDEEEDADENLESGHESSLAITRHLVLGPWHGISSFRETEVDLDHPPPGSHLESWYTCAMVCAAFCGTKHAGRGRILLVGLGGGAMASFVGRHWPGMTIEAVEIDPRIVHVAERWFGVACEPSFLSPHDGRLGSGLDEPSHFQMDPHARPTLVRVTSADAFVAAAVRDVECRYDVILLDVYTRGEFPSSLVNPTFFGQLVKLLKTQETHGWNGSLVVNAGVGNDRVLVEKLVRDVLPVTKTLLDANAASRLDDDNENSVIVGMGRSLNGGGDGAFHFSPKEWKQRAAQVADSWPEAPLPPFEIKNSVYGMNDEIMISWAGNSMLSAQNDGPIEKTEVKLLPKDDPEFSIFD